MKIPAQRTSELTSEVIRQQFLFFFTGFLKGLLPSSTRSNNATKGLPFFCNAASYFRSSYIRFVVRNGSVQNGGKLRLNKIEFFIGNCRNQELTAAMDFTKAE